MTRRKIFGLGAVTAAAALTLAACGGSSSGGGSTAKASFNQGLTSVVNSSSHTGGTMTFDLSSTPDSTDYDNTYYAYMWNFVRLYSMQLMTYKSCPGACGNTLVPQLATGPGQVTDNGLTWTYHIKPNVHFENGDLVTSKDVKYGIERSFAKDVLPNGPNYYSALLVGGSSYKGPYKNPAGLDSIATPDSTTIVFHLVQPFSDFDYVVAIPQSSPVEQSWDTGKYGGANFQLHPESTGPYAFSAYTLNKQFTLVKNTHWSAATDPEAKQLVDKIVVNLNVSQNQIDNNLVSNFADVDMSGTGVQTAAVRDKLLTNATQHADADNPINGFGRFVYINEKVIPNVHCREAIEFAANKTTLQNAWGGPVVGGAIASTVMPPTVSGYQQFDLYKAVSQPSGDATDAKAQLQQCGQPSGFSTGLAYRSDRPQETAAAQALQASLAQVGIKVTLNGYTSGKYYTNFAGDPAYVHAHSLGLDMGGWGPDWPDGYGFLDYLTNGATISPAGNTNIAEVNDPAVNSLFAQAGKGTISQNVAIWPQIDKAVMQQAAILPMVYQKVLLYRNPNLTNVYVDKAFGMYNYAVLGLK
ncbi:MAG TPA: ABC transporter substrate-binding protein [Streptosporangiaceae bacterium]|nr:ABC transporter substrate-binding protein [Streptosporangiaceae bacterium]